ncbi:hypothetical protein Acsp04_17900 [Actinomadura sp. NBRC 104425]|nr:hypothetical protein Acsp04_17900 [Actinomadura sp. NBRC 104425]
MTVTAASQVSSLRPADLSVPVTGGFFAFCDMADLHGSRGGGVCGTAPGRRWRSRAESAEARAHPALDLGRRGLVGQAHARLRGGQVQIALQHLLHGLPGRDGGGEEPLGGAAWAAAEGGTSAAAENAAQAGTVSLMTILGSGGRS